ncbi:antiterminator Q family protein [Orbus sturtevantii]|uniref:antiterminator Q family protein n=1 Tax=Orbus sturtevantii TaxID=3074109 RepID=UPI00370D916B
MIAEERYQEVFEVDEQFELTQQEINSFIANRDITHVLNLWGAYNRSELDYLGFSGVSTGFTPLLTGRKSSEKCSEDDAIIIDSIISRLQNNQDNDKKTMAKIIKYFYLGAVTTEILNPVPIRNIKMIGDLVGCGETKVKKLKESAENYICGSLDSLDKVLDCELYRTIQYF